MGTLPGNITGEKSPFADFLDSPSGRFFKAKVAEALTRDFEQLARELLAAPKKGRRTGRELRFDHGIVIRLDESAAAGMCQLAVNAQPGNAQTSSRWSLGRRGR